jgi:hypothetical protein
MNLIHVIDSLGTENMSMCGFFHGHLEKLTGDDRAVGEIFEAGPVIVQLPDKTLINAEATKYHERYLIHFSDDPAVDQYIKRFGS